MNTTKKYPTLIGKCKDCLGCMRLEDPEFKGIYRCNWNEEETNEIYVYNKQEANGIK